jgi:hypothetical protein
MHEKEANTMGHGKMDCTRKIWKDICIVMLRKEASEVGGWERRLIKSKTGRDGAGKGDYIVGVGYGNEVLMVNEIHKIQDGMYGYQEEDGQRGGKEELLGYGMNGRWCD